MALGPTPRRHQTQRRSACMDAMRGREALRVSNYLAVQQAERNPFNSVFHIHTTNGRWIPLGHGWFFTKDERDYAPDEIAPDHRD